MQILKNVLLDIASPSIGEMLVELIYRHTGFLLVVLLLMIFAVVAIIRTIRKENKKNPPDSTINYTGFENNNDE